MGVYRYAVTSDVREMEDDNGMDDYVVARYVFAFKYWYGDPPSSYIRMEKRKLKAASDRWDAMEIKPNCDVDKFQECSSVVELPDHVRSGYVEEHDGAHVGFLRQSKAKKEFYIDTKHVPVAHWHSGYGYKIILWIKKEDLRDKHTQPITIGRDMDGLTLKEYRKSGKAHKYLQRENLYKDPTPLKDRDFSHLIPSLKIPSLKKEDKYKLISDKLNIGIS